MFFYNKSHIESVANAEANFLQKWFFQIGFEIAGDDEIIKFLKIQSSIPK